MSEIGYSALVVAFVACLYSIIASIFGLRGNHPRLVASARKSILAVSVLVSVSATVLIIALVTHNFQMEYVYSYTSSDLSLPYLISALWAGNAGSLLFWGWLLSLSAAVVVLKKQTQGKELVPYASVVIMVILAFLLSLLIFTSSPFPKLPFVPADGAGLNPILENLGMIFHPPTLVAGYALLAIPFAFAMAALITKRLGNDWIVAVRRWALLTWLLLGIGNIIGAWWAYVELGWGGYWAWDAVENAGLMPWLVVTAFIHSIMLQKRREMFKLWNMVLIILAFTLSIFGTFLTRSGILFSVHTFAESAMGPFFLVFLGLTLLGSLALVFYRRKELRDEAEIDALVSRESIFFINNLLLVGITLIIFLGTVSRLDQAFFNLPSAPIFLVIILLSGFCALIGWRPPPTERLKRELLWPAVASIIIVIVLALFGIRHWLAFTAYFLCAFVLLVILSRWFQDPLVRRSKADNYLKVFWSLLWSKKSRYGGFIVHIAIVLIAIGIVGSSLFDVGGEAVLAPGESMAIKDYTLTYEGLGDEVVLESGESMTVNDYILTHEGLEAQATPIKKIFFTANVSVYKGDSFIGTMKPEVQVYLYPDQTVKYRVAEVAIRSTLAEDLYVILVGWAMVDSADLSQGYFAGFSVLANPLVIWLWIGGGVFLLGGLLAFWPERRG